MKKTALLIVFFVCAASAFGQDITGQWYGLMNVSTIELKVVFNISKTADGYSATMDSPDQEAKGIPATSVSFGQSVLKIENTKINFQFEGTLNKDNVIVGKFIQGGQTYPLEMSRTPFGAAARPQEPKPPFPYYSEDIKFVNERDKIELAGTLTLPRNVGMYPVVVMITGSGPQNRNEELLGHKPFLVIADFLTRNGFGVLRVDDRGVAESKGDFKTATTLDFSYDVEAAVKYLKTRKEINKKKIGLIGHSEGGMIAPMVAARSRDIAFIVLLAGPGIPGDKLLLLQAELIGRASGVPEAALKQQLDINRGAFEIVKSSTDPAVVKDRLSVYLKKAYSDALGPEKPAGYNGDDAIRGPLSELSSVWMQYFILLDPAVFLSRVKCPVLALNGGNDLQVPPKEDLAGISSSLLKAGNKKVTTIELPKLNHLFQESATGLPADYGKIEQTFSPAALAQVLQWMKNIVR
jgi:uncharacterized protein